MVVGGGGSVVVGGGSVVVGGGVVVLDGGGVVDEGGGFGVVVVPGFGVVVVFFVVVEAARFDVEVVTRAGGRVVV